MKEFQTQKGGRKIFNEDFEMLQDLINSTIGFFSDCGLNYVISGCETTDDKVSEGFVFLAGKIRKIKETSISNSLKPVIVPTYSIIEGEYEDGSKGIIRECFDAKVVGVTEYYSGDCIQSVKNANGKYVFKSIKDTLWRYYMLIKDSNDIQQLMNKVIFSNAVKAINLILKDNGKEITIDNINGNFEILAKNSGKKSFAITFSGDNGILFTDDKDEIFSVDIKSDKIIKLNNLRSVSLNADEINADNILIREKSLEELYYTKADFADTGWQKIVKVSDNIPIDSLYARSRMGEVTIQGTLPIDFFTSLTIKENDQFNNDFRKRYYTDYKLPTSIRPAACPMAVAFQSISNAKGGMGMNIYIDEDNRFYLVENKIFIPVEYDGVGQSSLPEDNSSMIEKLSNSIPGFNTGDMMVPSVVWRFFTDAPIKLSLITRSGELNGDIAFNARTNILHCWMKYYETIKITDLSTNTSRVEHNVKNLRVTNISVHQKYPVRGETNGFPSSYFNNYPITPKKEVVNGYDKDMNATTWESSGYEFHNPYSGTELEVTVTYEKSLTNEYNGMPTQKLEIRRAPSDYYLEIVPNCEAKIINGEEKNVCKSLNIQSWWSSYFEVKGINGETSGREWQLPCTYEITKGKDSIKLHTYNSNIDDVYEFTDNAINSSTSPVVSVKQNVSDKQRSLMLDKRAYMLEKYS